MTRLIGILLDIARNLVRVYWQLVNPISIGVSIIVRDGRGHVLLVEHTYGARGLHLPGGGVHKRETLLAALDRELGEETNLRRLGEPWLLGAYTNMHLGKSDHVVCFVLDDDRWDGEPRGDGIEVSAVRWVDPENLPGEGVQPGVRRRMEELVQGGATAFEW